MMPAFLEGGEIGVAFNRLGQAGIRAGWATDGTKPTHDKCTPQRDRR